MHANMPSVHQLAPPRATGCEDPSESIWLEHKELAHALAYTDKITPRKLATCEAGEGRSSMQILPTHRHSCEALSCMSIPDLGQVVHPR